MSEIKKKISLKGSVSEGVKRLTDRSRPGARVLEDTCTMRDELRVGEPGDIEVSSCRCFDGNCELGAAPPLSTGAGRPGVRESSDARRRPASIAKSHPYLAKIVAALPLKHTEFPGSSRIRYPFRSSQPCSWSAVSVAHMSLH